VHEAVDPVPAVPSGRVVVDASGVEVGVSVGRETACFVSCKVAVTKRAAVGAGVTSETLIQDASPRVTTRVKIQIFFISGFYFA